MATITVTRSLLSQGAQDDLYLISAFQRNSMEFTVERGVLVGTYATVLVGTFEFRAVKTGTVGTTDSYIIDVTTVLPNLLAIPDKNYVTTFLRVVPDLIKDLSNIRENFADLSPIEKENFYKVVKELAIIIGAMLVLFLLGYADLDKDRFKKMKDNNYFHNLLLYEILSSYNEIAGLSPLRGFGFFEEASGNVTKTSMAFGEIGKVIDVLKDFSFWIVGSEEGVVQKNSAFAKKGDTKWINDLKKLFPINNLTGTFSNEQLMEQTKNYVLQLERN